MDNSSSRCFQASGSGRCKVGILVVRGKGGSIRDMFYFVKMFYNKRCSVGMLSTWEWGCQALGSDSQGEGFR